MVRTNIHALFGFILLLVAVNILLLDVMVFSQTQTREPVSIVADTTPIPTKPGEICSQACQTLITQAIEKRLRSQQDTSIAAPPTVNLSTGKEFYIPLGVGSTRSTEYTELSGAEVYIDSLKYPNITQVTFEVFLRNPTGNGRTYAKLFNATDKHDVWFSEVYMEGSTVTRKEATISLDPGNKLYRVILKSTLGYDVYVDAARIKIVTK